MEDPHFGLSVNGVTDGHPTEAPKHSPAPGRAPAPAENPEPDPDEEQTGIVPGEIPGRPTDPADPRFPGSQPDLA
jgi:hypothetical protein